MSTTVEAIYENGMLKLVLPLPLAEKTPVVVTIETKADYSGAGSGRETWLKGRTLMKAGTGLVDGAQ